MGVFFPGLQAYSNRAACYTKLGALPEGLKDAEKCIELDSSFTKGYTRKGAIQFFMKEYDKAMETYQEGLKHDPKNQELLDGVRRFATVACLLLLKSCNLSRCIEIVCYVITQMCGADQQSEPR